MTLFANLGARRDHRVGGSGDADRLVHADADLKVPLGNGLYAHLAPQVLLFDWGDNGFDQKDFAEIGSSLTVSHGSTIAVTVSADYTDNPLMGMGSDGNLANPLYGAVEVQVKPSAAVTLQAFAGARRAGIQCSGGQCRFLPGFEGVRFAARASF